MNKFLMLISMAAILMFSTLAEPVFAYVVYTDYASFAAAAGSTVLHDFDSDSAGYIKSPGYGTGHPGDVRDFGAFSIDSTGSGIYLTEVRDFGANKDIYMNSKDDSAALKVIFDNDVKAVGFTYGAEGNDVGYDHSTFSLLGTTWDLGTPGDTGFFGVVEDSGTFAAGTAFSFGQNSYNWSGVSFDNLRYSGESNPVPEPATILLLGSGLVGLFASKKRKV